METENKHHRWTGRGRLPISLSVLGWLKVMQRIVGVPRNMPIASEGNALASSALCKSKENNVLYRMAILKVKIIFKIFSEYYLHRLVER